MLHRHNNEVDRQIAPPHGTNLPSALHLLIQGVNSRQEGEKPIIATFSNQLKC